MIEAMSHNVFLIPVALCALLSFGISVERLYYLFFRAAVASAPFMAQIQRNILGGDLQAALLLCAAEPTAPLSRVVQAALLHADAEREDMLLAVETAAMDVAPAVQQRTAYLAALANVVTLIGLLGTIVGLIQSFDAVKSANLEEKQTLLAGGISIAMFTTAGGIAVAIPTLAMYAILSQRGNAILDDVERCGLKAAQLLLLRQKSPQGRAGAGAPGAEPA